MNIPSPTPPTPPPPPPPPPTHTHIVPCPLSHPIPDILVPVLHINIIILNNHNNPKAGTILQSRQEGFYS